MNDTPMTEPDFSGASREEMMSALFAHMVMQQSNMAMMLMGKVAHPESGKTIQDMDAARMFIDQLEMLEAKTKGNLTKEESNLLKQSLMSLRLTFVEAVKAAPATQPEAKPSPQPQPSEPAKTGDPSTTPQAAPSEAEEHRKKFTKKYGVG